MARPSGVWMQVEQYYSSTAGNSKAWSSIWWFLGSATPVQPIDYAAAAFAAGTGLHTVGYLGVLGSDVNGFATRIIMSDGSTTEGATDYSDYPGAAPDPALPEEECAIVRLLTATSGRKGRGRLRIAGITEGAVTGNYLNDTPAAALNTWAGGLRSTGFTAAGVNWKLHMYSRADNILRQITSINAVGLLGTQRHRRPRV